jgi:hypothetical protein
LAFIAAGFLPACGSDSTDVVQQGQPGGAQGAGGAAAGGSAGSGGVSAGGSAGSGGVSAGGSAGSGGTAVGGAAGSGASTVGPVDGGKNDATTDAGAPKVPAATGTCPDFVSGDVTFSPAGIAARQVKLAVGSAAGGALVIYWHGTGSSPAEAAYGLTAGSVSDITSKGGVVAAPYHVSAAGTWPWFLVSGTQLDDLVLADEIVACAVAKKNIDARHIHVSGMSAGGLQTAQMSIRRSSYVASAAPYSGGIGSWSVPAFQDPSNKLAAMIFWGGTADVVSGASFQDASLAYSKLIRDNGGFTILCNHGGGHTIPSGAGASVWRFFQDHPFGTIPSPYVSAGLPAGFPAYCTM